MSSPSRRDTLRSAVALAGAALTSSTMAQPAPSNPTTAPVAPPPPPPAAPLTPDDLAVADRIAGRPPLAQPAQALAAPVVTRRRFALRSIRDDATPLPWSTLPPTPFTPYLPDHPPPPPNSSTSPPFRWSGGPIDWDGNPDSLAFATLRQLAGLLRSKRLTSVQLTQLYLDRLKRLGPDLYCVVTLTEDLALDQAAAADRDLAAGLDRGPLHGIPYGLKDLFHTRTYPTTCGIAPWKDRVVDEDATVVRRLAAAGAVLVAKLSLGELAMGDVWFGGLTRNPWKPDTGSSGSSAGSAAAVAAGLVPATDYLRAQRLRERLKVQWADALRGVDVYLAIPRFGPSLVATNLTGHPSLITRAGLAGGLPVMLEFVGNLHREPAMVALAAAYECETDHLRLWPEAFMPPRG